MLKNPLARAVVLGIVLLGSAAAWYLISPLFVNAMLQEGYPTVRTMASRTPKPPTETPTSTPIPTVTPQNQEAIFESGSALLIWESEFYALAHNGRGSAKVFLMEDGGLILRLEAFEVEDGPDLHVYLVAEDPMPNSQGVEPALSFDLGRLKGLVGDQTYVLPAEIDLNQYHSVVIWCVPYQIPFIAAKFQVQ